MTADRIADVLQEVYYSGHVTAGGQKLDREDFLQMVYLAKASILWDKYVAQELLGEMLNLNEMLQEYTLPVVVDKYNRKVALLPNDVVQLPGNAGVYSVSPLSSDNTIVTCNPIIRMMAGSEWLFCDDFGGPFAYFVPFKDKLVLYNLDACIKELAVSLIANTPDSNIPDDIGWDIWKQVYAQVVRTYAIPVDKRNDGNPNADEIFQTKLTSPQINR